MVLNRILLGFVALTTLVHAEVLITGATGRTGSLTYALLKKRGIGVRGLVRNVTKAREVLGCVKCDSSEGIFVGDVTKADTLVDSLIGATALIILTSSNCMNHAPPPQCHYATGNYPVDVDWNGGKNQITAYVAANAAAGPIPVILISTMGTTNPNSTLQMMGNGYAMSYKLNFEAYLMSSGFPFTIIKPCGLNNAAPANMTLMVGHDDSMNGHADITRADVARVTVAALENLEVAKNLRFDLCAHGGKPTLDADLSKLLHSAHYPWSQETSAPHLVI